MNLADRINGVLRRVPTWPVYSIGTLPVLWLIWLGVNDGLGVDPTKRIEKALGETGLQFLIAVLAVTPLRRWAGVSLIKFRRALGLLAFFYICLHLMTWLVLDYQFLWGQIWADIVKRPYITLGMLGFASMVPLAATSNIYAIRRLGASGWQKLHRLTYLAAASGALHHLLMTKTLKSWTQEPVIYLMVVVVLLVMRLLWIRRRVVA